jgi:trans-aconitate methyltransferase
VSYQTYQWNAEDYAAHSAAQFGWALELLGKLTLQGDEDVLDIGCGDGKVTAELAALVPRGSVVGIDSSPAMIDLASHRYPRALFRNLTFVRMDAREMTFAAAFDVVFSNSSLHWIKEQPVVLEGVRSSLREGGRLLAQMGGRGNAAQLAPAFLEVVSQADWSPYFRDMTSPYWFFTPEEYRTFLLQAGLEPVRAELLPKQMKQQGRAGVAGWIRTTWLPFTDRVPAPLREAFVEAIVDRFLTRHPPDAQSVVRLEMVRLEVEARRP